MFNTLKRNPEGNPAVSYGDGLRVGLIAACPFPASHGTPGGIREKAEAMARLGCDVHVITYPCNQEIAVEGVTIHRVPRIGPVGQIVVGPTWFRPIWDLLLALKAISIVRKEGLHLLHGMNYEGVLAGAIAKWVTGCPLVYGAVNTMSDELPSYKFMPAPIARVLAWVLDGLAPGLADHAVCYTREICRFLEDQGMPRERIDIVRLGIDVNMFAQAEPDGVRTRLGLNGEPVIAYAGVLNEFQRIDYLLGGMKTVLEREPHAKLVFVQTVRDLRHQRQVADMAREMRIADNVMFPPVIPFEALPSYLAASDLTCIPRPDCPGVPVKIINFMAAGKPIVVCEGSAKGLRDGEEALVTPDHDPQALGEAMLRVIRDKALARRIGDAAQRKAYAEYDRMAAGRHLIDIYRHVLRVAAAPATAAVKHPYGMPAAPTRKPGIDPACVPALIGRPPIQAGGAPDTEPPRTGSA